MSSDPFVILGISKNASQNEIYEAYKAKRDMYKEHIFDEGEAGALAARKVEQIEQAYKDAMEMCHENATVSGEGNSSFENVKQAIRDKNPDLAQKELDKVSFRGAEWHYFQSIVFYEKNWLNDSKKQLEIALQMDPSNPKYQRALENIKKKVDGSRPYDGTQNVYQDNGTSTGRTYSQNSASTADGCCAACQALWCADCCCECMGGDLIRCC
ncbi:MAG: hypothetical protein NC303_03865 [Firmicutes bacterium]|nr:hypothetical protein [Bacillota bacterium]